MNENMEFDFVPDANERQDILPYQYEPEPVEVSRDSDSENDSDGESDRNSETDSDGSDREPGRVGNTDWLVLCLISLRLLCLR